jgi:hypothetical protein
MNAYRSVHALPAYFLLFILSDVQDELKKCSCFPQNTLRLLFCGRSVGINCRQPTHRKMRFCEYDIDMYHKQFVRIDLWLISGSKQTMKFRHSPRGGIVAPDFLNQYFYAECLNFSFISLIFCSM